MLHPIVPPTLSRLVRFAVMPISLIMSFATPYRYAIEPRNQAIGVNCACSAPVIKLLLKISAAAPRPILTLTEEN